MRVFRPVVPGSGISFFGTDMTRGELVPRRCIRLTSRETGELAAIGRGSVEVVCRPSFAVLSTGDAIVAPRDAIRPTADFDVNATLLADAVRELGGEPRRFGIVGDDEPALAKALARALECDLVVQSGGTSRGAGDGSDQVLVLSYPGIVVHGGALKPGEPICFDADGRTPVVILPGLPTSAIFTLNMFVTPCSARWPALSSGPSHERHSSHGCPRGSISRSDGPSTSWSISSPGRAVCRSTQWARGRAR